MGLLYLHAAAYSVNCDIRRVLISDLGELSQFVCWLFSRLLCAILSKLANLSSIVAFRSPINAV